MCILTFHWTLSWTDARLWQDYSGRVRACSDHAADDSFQRRGEVWKAQAVVKYLAWRILLCISPIWNACMQGVEEVASQNSVLSAKAVLKGLVRSTDVAICQEVEVVAAKYDLKDGKVSVIKRGWYSGRSFYYE